MRSAPRVRALHCEVGHARLAAHSVSSGHGEGRRHHDRRGRARAPRVERRPGDLPGDRGQARDHEARRGPVLPLRRGRHHARALPPTDDARALAEGRPPGHRPLDEGEGRRRRLLPEARPEGSPGLPGDRAHRVPLAATPTRSARPRSPWSVGGPRWARSRSIRGRCGDDADHPDELRLDLDPQPGTDFDDAVRGRVARASSWPSSAMSAFEDLGGRGVHLRPDRAALDVHGRAARSDRLRARAGAPAPARSRRSGGRRSGARRSSSTTTRTPATARSPRPTACVRSRPRPSPRP